MYKIDKDEVIDQHWPTSINTKGLEYARIRIKTYPSTLIFDPVFNA